MTSAWPFLIARGRRRDYRTVLAPDLLPIPAGPGRLADVLPVGRPDDGPRRVEVALPELGRLVVTAQAEVLRPSDVGGSGGLDAVTDEHGRPLVHLYGLVTSADDPGMPGEADMATARATAMDAYRTFLADEPSFAGLRSSPIPVPPAAVAPARAPRPSTGHPTWSEEPRPSAPPRRGPLLALAGGLAAVLVVAVYMIHSRAPIEDLRVASGDPQRSCADVVLHTHFRLAERGPVMFWLSRDDVRIPLVSRAADEGENDVDLPGVALAPGRRTQLVAVTAGGERASADVAVQCREG